MGTDDVASVALGNIPKGKRGLRAVVAAELARQGITLTEVLGAYGDAVKMSPRTSKEHEVRMKAADRIMAMMSDQEDAEAVIVVDGNAAAALASMSNEDIAREMARRVRAAQYGVAADEVPLPDTLPAYGGLIEAPEGYSPPVVKVERTEDA